MVQRASVSPPRHRALAEQSVEVSENRGLERDHLEGDDLLLPEFDLPLAGSGEFAAGDQQPVALGKNLRRRGGGRHRQNVDAMAWPVRLSASSQISQASVRCQPVIRKLSPGAFLSPSRQNEV